MVHARSLSFTNDSTSVDFPSLSTGPTSGAATKSLTGPHSLESAGLLFQLRYTQSCWYQELFQSSRSPLQNESVYIWQICQEMREWSESFPDSLPLSFKDFFDLELLYSYIYCLSPSCRIPAVSLYAKTLIFEYSIAYMQKIFPISRDPVNVAFYTYHDALRVYFVGSQFLAVLVSDQDQLLGGILPYTPIIPGNIPPAPPLPVNAGIDSVERSINCVKHIKETLRTFGHRWDDSKALLSNYEAQVEPMLTSLLQRKHHLGGIARNSHSPPGFVHQASFDRMGNISTDGWANVGAAFASNPLQGGVGLGPGGSAHGL
jgi:hypothetical protein